MGHGLGYGTRCEAADRTEKDLNALKAVLENLLGDKDLSDTHGFLGHFLAEVEEAAKTFYKEVEAIGEAAFSEQLREDHGYWSRCRERWGGGSGYTSQIRNWTSAWFSEEGRQERRRFIEAETQRRWGEMLRRLLSQIESAGPTQSTG